MQISDEVIKILEYLGSKIGVTIDWTSSNVLPYIKELCEKFISWETSTSIAWIVIMTCIAIITLIFALFTDWGGVEWFIFACFVLATILVVGKQVFDIIECRVFPEKMIYDYIQLYVK